MKKQKVVIGSVLFLLMICLGGCGGKVETFAEWCDVELFQNVPAMVVEGSTISDAVDYGDDNYVITVSETVKEDYDTYLALLENSGYEKYVDNEEGLDGAVFSASFTKDNLTLTVVHIASTAKTYVSVGENQPLSEHLIYKDEYIADNEDGAKTTLHMVELYYFGSSYVMQLKNGHFIVNDGGTDYDTAYLLDYLESLVPNGEKPVIEAWIISHGHYDHIGIMKPFYEKEGYAERIFVEGVYFSEPNKQVIQMDSGTKYDISFMKSAVGKFKTTSGETTQIYRFHTGQRYYFNDVVLDIALTQEQILIEDYDKDFNESSTWCMYTIEGQKFLFGGDSAATGMKTMMDIYSEDYIACDIFSALHHGENTRNDFTEYCKVKDVVLYSGRAMGGGANNQKLQATVQEYYCYKDGTKIMTFPYEVGTMKLLPNNEWKYHVGQARPKH